MPKLKGPLFSLSAQGALARLLTFRRHGSETVVGIPTTHPDAGSPAQLSGILSVPQKSRPGNPTPGQST